MKQTKLYLVENYSTMLNRKV